MSLPNKQAIRGASTTPTTTPRSCRRVVVATTVTAPTTTTPTPVGRSSRCRTVATPEKQVVGMDMKETGLHSAIDAVQNRDAHTHRARFGDGLAITASPVDCEDMDATHGATVAHQRAVEAVRKPQRHWRK